LNELSFWNGLHCYPFHIWTFYIVNLTLAIVNKNLVTL
jgi:hypothetical protein